MTAERRRAATLVLVGGAALLTCVASVSAVATPAQARGRVSKPARVSRGGPLWIGAWQMAPTAEIRPPCRRCTIRDIVHVSVGGTLTRVRLSNDLGARPLRVDHTTLALPTAPGRPDARPSSMRTVTFGGQRSVVIPAGQHVFSDPTPLTVAADSDLLVTTYTPDPAIPLAYHPSAQQISYLSDGQDNAGTTAGGALPTRTVSYWVASGVDVRSKGEPGSLVALGDSITDGAGSTVGRNARWPDFLARRMAGLPVDQRLGVLNAGIGGNRLLRDGGVRFGPRALDRFDRDVLGQTGVQAVIVLLGINDIQQRPRVTDPEQIISALSDMAESGHDQGLLVIGGTLTPDEGWSDFTPAGERVRLAVNAWIRRTRDLDGYVDFDAAVRDPARPSRMLARYDSGDHLHPGDAGYQRMAAAVNLAELGRKDVDGFGLSQWPAPGLG